jgi:hypothetical protein
LPGGAGSVAAIAATSPEWASDVTSLTPDRPRAVRSRKKRQPAGAVLAGGDLHAENLAVSIGVDAGRDQDVHGHHPGRPRRP